jgi:hypothetical protein
MWVIVVKTHDYIYGTFPSKEAAVKWAEEALSTMYDWIPIKIHQV